MILKPFKVHSPDGKSFYEGEAAEMTQSPAPASPSGEDAANVAIGEREAFLTWWCADVPEYMREKWKESVDECLRNNHAQDKLVGAWDGFQFGLTVARATLTAEKVAAVTLPIMRAAFRVTETEGDPDPNKQRFHMRFTFRSMEELHAADDQWRAFVAQPANQSSTIPESFKRWFEREWASYQDKAISDGKITSMTWALKGYRAALTAEKVAGQDLAVWYGPMPESNGKTDWTAILHKGDLAEGHTIDRSEYPDRVRYAADCVRYLIGELQDRPWILDYDADKHSGYVAPTAALEHGGGRDAWQPIESAPEGKLLVVSWLDKDDPENPERHAFDFIEDGGWVRHNEDYDHFLCVAPPGSRGPSEDAPYKHWMALPDVPAAMSQKAGEQG